jgi:hypothetical protein
MENLRHKPSPLNKTYVSTMTGEKYSRELKTNEGGESSLETVRLIITEMTKTFGNYTTLQIV